MTELDRRVLYGKLAGMEADLREAYRAISRVEEWIHGMKKMLERVKYKEEENE